MTRRVYRPLTLSTGSPVAGESSRRTVNRRTFRQLTGATPEKPLPVGGSIYRTFSPSFIADYAGLSTISWTSGTTGASTNWNCYYIHWTTPNQRTTTVSYISDPVRWACDVPSASGGNYDWWSAVATTTVNEGGTWTVDPTNNGAFVVGMTKGLLPTTGSHVESTTGTIAVRPAASHLFWSRFGVMPAAVRVTAPLNQFVDANFQSIASTTKPAAVNSLKIKAIRHRINGSFVGAVIEDPGSPYEAATAANWYVDVVSGDEYEIDVWYELAITADQYGPSEAGKACWYIPTSRVSNSSTRISNNGLNVQLYSNGATNSEKQAFRHIEFYGYNFSTAYDRTLETYELTINGLMTWRWPNGTVTDKIRTFGSGVTGWTADFTTQPGNIIWTGPVNATSQTPVLQVLIRYNVEVPFVRIKWSASFSQQYSLGGQTYFRPIEDGTYLSDTYDRNSATTVTHDRHGSFDQGGSTDFYALRGKNIAYKGTRPGAVVFPTQIPTYITLTKVDQ